MPLKSFIEVESKSHFPLENLPFGIFKPRDGLARVGVALGEFVVDLSVLEEKKLVDLNKDRRFFSHDSLNAFFGLGRPSWRRVRERLQHLLAAETSTLRDDAGLREHVF